MKRLLIWGMSLAVVSLPNFSLAQNGDAYRLLGNSIRVDRVSHWENWNYQNDLVASLNVPINKADIFQVEAGGLRPVFFRRNINVAAGANNFTYPDLVRAGGALTIGGATAKSNAALANNKVEGLCAGQVRCHNDTVQYQASCCHACSVEDKLCDVCL